MSKSDKILEKYDKKSKFSVFNHLLNSQFNANFQLEKFSEYQNKVFHAKVSLFYNKTI